MELYTMRYVLAVAEHENFSLAAQACHVGQPALSQQVARLEKELGIAWKKDTVSPLVDMAVQFAREWVR